MITTQRRVNLVVGEDLAYKARAGIGTYRVFKREKPDDHAAGWVQAGGWSFAMEQALAGELDPDGMAYILPGLVVAEGGATLPWASVRALMALSGTVAEGVQVVEYVDGKAVLVFRYVLPMGLGDPLDVILAQDRELLDLMVKQRTEIATTDGVRQLQLPDGRTEEYASIEVWDRRIMEVRARVAWLEQAQAGNVLPRMEIW